LLYRSLATPISCTWPHPTTACAAVSKESRMKFANANKLHRKSGGSAYPGRAKKECMERNFLPAYATGKVFTLNFLRRCDISDNQVSRSSTRGNRVDDSTPHPSRSASPRSTRFIKLLLKEARYSMWQDFV